MTGLDFALANNADTTGRSYFHNSSAPRINTDTVLVEALRIQYPNWDLAVVPRHAFNLIAYAYAGHATATPLEDAVHDPVYSVALKWRLYLPPARRLGGGDGAMAEDIIFGKFLYKWKDQEFIVYVADGRDGCMAYPAVSNHYILSHDSHKVDELIREATKWGVQLHNEVWVFDQGWWLKNRQLYEAVAKSSWENVILDEGMKKAIIADVENFFDGQDTYEKLQVPWKRGIIYYGPPGNGKTISIKAMMHTLYQRGVNGDDRLSVPTLYVRSLSSFAGPEYSIQQIFTKAREEAPCYLVFEDLDSLVTDHVRSYFLNEVDGLKSNNGILIVGSTNHLDRLDPGISKRPSRFDRKYFFPNPNHDQRVQYAQFWQGKLKDNKEIEFPDKLCSRIADITDKFSFAYMQEAFVASLLTIAADKHSTEEDAHRWAGPQDPMHSIRTTGGGDDDPDLAHLKLWVEIQKQVKLLRDEMDEKRITEKMESLLPRPAVSHEKAPVMRREEEGSATRGGRSVPTDTVNDVFRMFR